MAKKKHAKEQDQKKKNKQGDPMSTNDSIYDMRPSVESQQNVRQTSPLGGDGRSSQEQGK